MSKKNKHRKQVNKAAEQTEENLKKAFHVPQTTVTFDAAFSDALQQMLNATEEPSPVEKSSFPILELPERKGKSDAGSGSVSNQDRAQKSFDNRMDHALEDLLDSEKADISSEERVDMVLPSTDRQEQAQQYITPNRPQSEQDIMAELLHTFSDSPLSRMESPDPGGVIYREPAQTKEAPAEYFREEPEAEEFYEEPEAEEFYEEPETEEFLEEPEAEEFYEEPEAEEFYEEPEAEEFSEEPEEEERIEEPEEEIPEVPEEAYILPRPEEEKPEQKPAEEEPFALPDFVKWTRREDTPALFIAPELMQEAKLHEEPDVFTVPQFAENSNAPQTPDSFVVPDIEESTEREQVPDVFRVPDLPEERDHFAMPEVFAVPDTAEPEAVESPKYEPEPAYEPEPEPAYEPEPEPAYEPEPEPAYKPEPAVEVQEEYPIEDTASLLSIVQSLIGDAEQPEEPELSEEPAQPGETLPEPVRTEEAHLWEANFAAPEKKEDTIRYTPRKDKKDDLSAAIPEPAADTALITEQAEDTAEAENDDLLHAVPVSESEYSAKEASGAQPKHSFWDEFDELKDLIGSDDEPQTDVAAEIPEEAPAAAFEEAAPAEAAEQTVLAEAEKEPPAAEETFTAKPAESEAPENSVINETLPAEQTKPAPAQSAERRSVFDLFRRKREQSESVEEPKETQEQNAAPESLSEPMPETIGTAEMPSVEEAFAALVGVTAAASVFDSAGTEEPETEPAYEPAEPEEPAYEPEEPEAEPAYEPEEPEEYIEPEEPEEPEAEPVYEPAKPIEPETEAFCEEPEAEPAYEPEEYIEPEEPKEPEAEPAYEPEEPEEPEAEPIYEPAEPEGPEYEQEEPVLEPDEPELPEEAPEESEDKQATVAAFENEGTASDDLLEEVGALLAEPVVIRSAAAKPQSAAPIARRERAESKLKEVRDQMHSKPAKSGEPDRTEAERPEKAHRRYTEKLGTTGTRLAALAAITVVSVLLTVYAAVGGSLLPLTVSAPVTSYLLLALMLIAAVLAYDVFKEALEKLRSVQFAVPALVALTLLAIALDTVQAAASGRIPFCAAGTVLILLLLWDRYDGITGILTTLRVLCDTKTPTGIVEVHDVMKGRVGLSRSDGSVDDFMDKYEQAPPTKKLMQYYVPAAAVISVLAAAIIAAKTGGPFLWTVSLLLLGTLPLIGILNFNRLFCILSKRLSDSDAALCGWYGAETFGGDHSILVGDRDLFPEKNIKLNGIKVIANDADRVIGYTAATAKAAGSVLYPLFEEELRSRNARHYHVERYRFYESGGIGAEISGDIVLMGTLEFMRRMGVHMEGGMKLRQAVYTSVNGELAAVFAIKYSPRDTVRRGLSAIAENRHFRTIFVTRDFLMTPEMISEKYEITLNNSLYPSAKERMRLSETELKEKGKQGAVMADDSFGSFADTAAGGRILHSAVRTAIVLTVLNGILGFILMAVLTFQHGFEAATAVNILLYQLIWLIPTLLLTGWTRRY